MPKTAKNPKNTIKQAFCTKNELTWTELLNQTKLSKYALSTHLKALFIEGSVKTKIDPNRPTRILYTYINPMEREKQDKPSAEQFKEFPPEKYETPCHEDMGYAPEQIDYVIWAGSLISKMVDREEAKEQLNKYLIGVAECLIQHVLGSAFFTLFTPEGKLFMERIENGVEMDLSVEVARLWERCHGLFDVNPMVETVFWTIFKNFDVFRQLKPLAVDSLFCDPDVLSRLSLRQPVCPASGNQVRFEGLSFMERLLVELDGLKVEVAER
jgi:DNA-binding HxlR family transcriptional regulator